MSPSDKDTRYFIDVDMHAMRVLGFGSGERHALISAPTLGPHHRRLFLTKGQFNKIVDDSAPSARAKTTKATTSPPSRPARTRRAP